MIGGMHALHPAGSGDFMYLNYSKLNLLKSELERDYAFLTKEKEHFDRQIARISLNTQTEAVVVEMRNTSGKLEKHIQAVKVMIAVLKRIEEEYTQCEDRITDRIENGKAPGKFSIAFFRKYDDSAFRRLLR